MTLKNAYKIKVSLKILTKFLLSLLEYTFVKDSLYVIVYKIEILQNQSF